MKKKNDFNRRNFIKSSILGVVSAGAVGGINLTGAEQKEKKEEKFKIKAYRTLGRTGFKVSDVSTGGPGNENLLNALLDAGVNYIDTAESYSRGKSETVTGKVLKTRERKKFFVSTKMGLQKDTSKEAFLKRARKCLERLQMDYVDCMMLHSPPTVKAIKTEGFHQACDQLKREGKLKYVGLSNHGSQWSDKGDPMDKVMLAAAADGRFDVMLLVYNHIQKEAGEKILKACKEKNIGTTLMKTNPVGGYLGVKEGIEKFKKEGKKVPKMYEFLLPRFKIIADRAQNFLKEHQLDNPLKIREASIKYVLANKNVNTVCCSFRTFEDINAFLKLSGQALTAEDSKTLALYQEGCGHLYCRHACGICEKSCPHRVPVNTIMRYNHYFAAQGREKYAMQKYAALPPAKANKCLDCREGYCETACPYGVSIHGLLVYAHDNLIIA